MIRENHITDQTYLHNSIYISNSLKIKELAIVY